MVTRESKDGHEKKCSGLRGTWADIKKKGQRTWEGVLSYFYLRLGTQEYKGDVGSLKLPREQVFGSSPGWQVSQESPRISHESEHEEPLELGN